MVDDLAVLLLEDAPAVYKIKDINSYSNCWNGAVVPCQPHDLYRLAERLSVLVNSNNIRAKCQEIMDLIKEIVIRPTEGEKDCIDCRLNGISAYFPHEKGDYSSTYDNLDFANDYKWDEFLKNCFSNSYYKNTLFNSLLSRLDIIKSRLALFL